MRAILVFGLFLASAASAKTLPAFSGKLVNFTDIPNNQLRLKVTAWCGHPDLSGTHHTAACESQVSQLRFDGKTGAYTVPEANLRASGVSWTGTDYKRMTELVLPNGKTLFLDSVQDNQGPILGLISLPSTVHHLAMKDGSPAAAYLKGLVARGLFMESDWRLEQVQPDGSVVSIDHSTGILTQEDLPLDEIRVVPHVENPAGPEYLLTDELKSTSRRLRLTLSFWVEDGDEDRKADLLEVSYEGEGAEVFSKVPDVLQFKK